MDAISKFYSPNIVSVEAVGNDTMPKELRGIDAIRQKNESWFQSFDVHSAEANGPFVGDDPFAVQYTFDTTSKAHR